MALSASRPFPKAFGTASGVAKSFLFLLFTRSRINPIRSAAFPFPLPQSRKLHHMRKCKFIRSIIDIYACCDVDARVYILFSILGGYVIVRGILSPGIFSCYFFFFLVACLCNSFSHGNLSTGGLVNCTLYVDSIL